MKLSTLLYNLKQGMKNIWRNKMFSLASVATMAACIFLFGIFYSIGINFQGMVKEAEEGVTITVFFNEGITDEEIQAIGELINLVQKLHNLPGILIIQVTRRFVRQ